MISLVSLLNQRVRAGGLIGPLGVKRAVPLVHVAHSGGSPN